MVQKRLTTYGYLIRYPIEVRKVALKLAARDLGYGVVRSKLNLMIKNNPSKGDYKSDLEWFDTLLSKSLEVSTVVMDDTPVRKRLSSSSSITDRPKKTKAFQNKSKSFSMIEEISELEHLTSTIQSQKKRKPRTTTNKLSKTETETETSIARNLKSRPQRQSAIRARSKIRDELKTIEALKQDDNETSDCTYCSADHAMISSEESNEGELLVGSEEDQLSEEVDEANGADNTTAMLFDDISITFTDRP